MIELEHIESNTGRLLGQTDSSLTKSIKNSFQKGDVLFGKLRPYLRKYAVAPFDGVCSSEIWVLKGTQLDNGFLYFLIQTDTFIEAANKSSGSKMPRADWSIVASLKFLIPSKKEQMKIASFLFAIETKVARTQAQLEKIEEWKKGLLQKMFV
ncbi:MAG: hypothetical protein EOP48_17320 [Sphingobacteriales bacterium]|nr:MAG: hypothetical protein EOP48_17320 [Sphingobacteriales bacterium]